MIKKTDNYSLAAKLDLRRYFLSKYHSNNNITVFDCCQGQGVIWRHLKKEFEVKHYWGVDKKPKPGRLKIDSLQILRQKGWTENVIDIDTYGSPWKHYEAAAYNAPHDITIFLTWGMLGNSSADHIIKKILNLENLDIPSVILAKIFRNSLSSLLSIGCRYAMILEAIEAESSGNARYFGVRLKIKEAHATRLNSNIETKG